MATIVTPNAAGLSDGDVFDPAGYNIDLFSDLGGGGRGIISEPNGGITGANFDPSFRVTPEMIQPGEACDTTAEGSKQKLDYFADKFLDVDEGREIFLPLAFGSKRVTLPYDCTVLLWEFQHFHSQWRLWWRDAQNSLHTADIITRIRVGGDIIEETRRTHAATSYISNVMADDWRDGFEYHGAAMTAQHYPQFDVSAGDYEARVEVYVGIPLDSGIQLTWDREYWRYDGRKNRDVMKDNLVYGRYTVGSIMVKASWWR